MKMHKKFELHEKLKKIIPFGICHFSRLSCRSGSI